MASTACACASAAATATVAAAASVPTTPRRAVASASPRQAFSLPAHSSQVSATFGNAFPSASPRSTGSFRTVHSLRRRAVAEETSTTTTAPASEAESDGNEQLEKLIKDLQDKWDGVENKQGVIVYAGGAFLAVWLSSTVVSALNTLPLLPKVLELVGLGYSSWFVYRYLLFKQSRKELGELIEEVKRKITGTTPDA